MREHGVALWSSREWRERATEWLDARLADAGLARTGRVDQPSLRAWATVLRAPTTGGRVWLKAAGPGTAFEVALYPLLQGAAPGRVLEPLAVDLHRGWLLLPDGGDPLGELLPGPAAVRALERVVAAYGRLQRDVAPQADAMLAVGVPDLRPSRAPAVFAETVALAAEGVAHRADPAEVQAYDGLARLAPAVSEWAGRLAASHVPASIDHNDLHPWNVLVPPGAAGDPAGRGRVYDWGDAVVGHPFASMLIPLRWVCDTTGQGPDGPAARRLRDAYLSVFTELGPRAELVADLEAACRIGMVGRALSWNRALRDAGEHLAGDHATAPVHWLAKLGNARHVGDD